MDQSSSSPHRQLTSGQDTWSARCGESRTPGAASGSGKRNGRKADTAPRPDSTRGAASSRTFSALDHYLWQLTYKWACYSHQNKSKHWIVNRYYGTFNPASQDRWVFGNRDNGAYLLRPSWTKIVRHSLVCGAASPDDPTLTDYWANRRGKNKPPLDRSVLHLLAKQKGRCALCTDLLLHADHEPSSPTEWEQWHRVTRKAITKQHVTTRGNHAQPDGTRLVHSHCWRRETRASTKEPALLYA